jgi:BMFP domain-containing protein YqiC
VFCPSGGFVELARQFGLCSGEREENEALKARIAVLEAKLGVSAAAPDSGGVKTGG